MNRRMMVLICGMMACSVLAGSFLTGCKKNLDEQQETMTMATETQEETRKVETLPPELTDPTGHYAYGGVSDSMWDEEEEIDATEAEKKSVADNKTNSSQNNVKTTEPTKAKEENKPTNPTEATKPSEATKPAESTKPTEGTKPTETTKPTEEDDRISAELGTAEMPDDWELTEYEKYMAMSPEAQQEFFNSFGSVDAFFQWLQDAKAEYEANQDYIEIGGGPIDIEGVLNGNAG